MQRNTREDKQLHNTVRYNVIISVNKLIVIPLLNTLVYPVHYKAHLVNLRIWPNMSPTIRLLWRRPLPSNSALNILQLWAFVGRTREPVLLKFVKEQKIRTTMVVTWSNIKIFKLKNGGRSLLENIRNAITRLPMDRPGRNLGGRIPSCSQYWKCYNSSYDGTD